MYKPFLGRPHAQDWCQQRTEAIAFLGVLPLYFTLHGLSHMCLVYSFELYGLLCVSGNLCIYVCFLCFFLSYFSSVYFVLFRFVHFYHILFYLFFLEGKGNVD